MSLILSPGRPNFQPCIYRGAYCGEASCGCGSIYLCKLLLQSDGNPLYCGDSVPIDEYVDIDGIMITKNNYQPCPSCPSRPPTPKTN